MSDAGKHLLQGSCVLLSQAKKCLFLPVFAVSHVPSLNTLAEKCDAQHACTPVSTSNEFDRLVYMSHRSAGVRQQTLLACRCQPNVAEHVQHGSGLRHGLSCF